MVFSSILFLWVLLPVVLAVYYLPQFCGKAGSCLKFQNFILVVFSLFFYAWGEPRYILLMLLSVLINYSFGLLIERKQQKLLMLVICVAANLLILGYFKYFNFFVEIWNGLAGSTVQLSVRTAALPIGISFYTFQTMSYTIDVYRNDADVQKDFIAFGAYVALFPQLVAGPIVQYKTVADQLKGRRESVDLFCNGIFRFVAGLGKKVLIANQMGMLWEEIAAMDARGLTTATAWLGILAFTFEIYFDFSGYSDMAVGLGAMFGFTFPENFDYPYESKSITEFWRRWHISLGTWFREYVYIPLGGNRKGIARQFINIAIVWFLTGLWHGAYWNFILWGIYYGILLIVEKTLWKRFLVKLPAIIGHIYTMLAVIFGWSLFAWQDMADSKAFMGTMFFQTEAGLANQQTMYLAYSYFCIILIAAVFSSQIPKKIITARLFPEGTIRRELAGMVFVAAVSAACIAMLVNSSYNPFLYFRF